MDPKTTFLTAFVEASGKHIADHNALAATPQGVAAGMLSMPTMTMADAEKLFCTDFPIAYEDFQKFSPMLQWIPGVGSSITFIKIALTAVKTSFVPLVCGPPASTA